MATALGSEQLGDLPAQVRDRAFFSARVEDERILAEMQDRLRARIELEKRDGRTMDRGVFVEEMHDILKQSGYRRPEGVKAGSLRDLKSTRRLSLIFDMNVAQAQGYARWAADMTPEGLENEPCYELIRVRNRMEIRNWPRLWSIAGGEFYGGAGSNKDYPQAPGRMIARKTDPIWREISRFEVPWPPFDWGSGMSLRGIDRAESDFLGVTSEDETFEVQSSPFNENFQMSARGLDAAARERLRDAMGGRIRFDGDEIILQDSITPETNEQRNQDIESSVQERSREYYLQASDGLERFQRDNDGAEVGFRGESESEIARTYLAQLAAVAVGRKQLFHDTMQDGQSDALLAAIKDFPKLLKVFRKDGHFIAYRSDLLGMSAEEIIALMQDGAGGNLLGYGRETMALNEAYALVLIVRATEPEKVIVGFHAPIIGGRAFAAARAKDLAHAFGEKMEVLYKEVRP